MLLDFSMTPLNQGASVSPFVARCVELIDRSGLTYRLHAMGTEVEGELDQLLDLLKQCFQALQVDCDRVTCTAKFDYRAGAINRLDGKIASVQQKLGRDLRS